MIAFLANDYQWIFSGIGVAVILLVIQFVVWLIKDLASRQITPPTVQPEADTPRQTHQSSLQSQPQASAQIPPYINNYLTPQAIIKEIRESPLLKQPEVAKKYEGQFVSWKGQIQSANIDGSKKVTGSILCDSTSILFEAPSQEQYKLMSVKMGDKIQITGKIHQAQSYIYLKDASITVLY